MYNFKIMEQGDIYSNIADRDNLIFKLLRFISTSGYKKLSTNHIECDENILKLKSQDAVFLYAGLHKSLWETTGTLVALDSLNIPLPVIGMGDNLVKGKFFQNLSMKAGVFLIKRPLSRATLIESAKSLKKDLSGFFSRGIDVMVFPEGTRTSLIKKGRYGDFFTTIFEAAKEYSDNFSDKKLYIVPFNIDYSKIREDKEMVSNVSSQPRTLKVFDTLKMLSRLGDIYLSFGTPVSMDIFVGKDRKYIAREIRQRCIDLVKILPANIVALALKQLIDEDKTTNIENAVKIKVEEVRDKLGEFSDKFRGFSMKDSGEVIFDKAVKNNALFKQIKPELLSIYNLYASYIYHYI